MYASSYGAGVGKCWGGGSGRTSHPGRSGVRMKCASQTFSYSPQPMVWLWLIAASKLSKGAPI